MRRKLVVGNWKMHGSIERAASLLAELKAIIAKEVCTDVAVCPPAIYISQAQAILDGSVIALGAQNVSEYTEGAYTGEISAFMLSDLACQYVIVGHSERRALFAESDEQVAEKFAVAQASGLKPILCVGESLVQREAGETLAFVEAQVLAVIDRVGVKSLLDAVVAYEPIWAIGTGETATPEQAQQVHAHLRQVVAKVCESTAEKLQILYGGSVNAVNAEDLFAKRDIDGALVGGASLQAEGFAAIVGAAELVG